MSRVERHRQRPNRLVVLKGGPKPNVRVAPGVTDSSSAARLKFRCRAAASNARRAFRGGNRRR